MNGKEEDRQNMTTEYIIPVQRTTEMDEDLRPFVTSYNNNSRESLNSSTFNRLGWMKTATIIG